MLIATMLVRVLELLIFMIVVVSALVLIIVKAEQKDVRPTEHVDGD